MIAIVVIASFAPAITHAGGTFTTSSVVSDNFCNDLGTCITGLVYIIPAISADAAFVVAYVFDLIVKLSLSSDGYAIDFLSTGWQTALSLANIAFLFILIYIAITILFQAETGGTMRMLATLIIMALLVNFSFLITRVVIDAGNILGVQFYNAINAQSFATEGGAAGALSSGLQGLGSFQNTSVKDLTEPIMEVIGLQNMFNNDAFQNWTVNQKGLSGLLTEIITLSTLFIAVAGAYWILIFAFTTAGVKFLMRTIVLWFVLMLAPLAFAARALSKGSSLYDRWQQALIEFSIYPAAFLFMFYILVETATNMSSGLKGNLASQIFNANQSLFVTLATLIIRLGIVMAMLWFGLQAVDNIAAEGNKFAHKIAGNVTGKVRGWATALPKAVGRGAVGAAKSGANEAYHGSVGLQLQKVDEKFRLSPQGNSKLGAAIRERTTKAAMDKNILGFESRNQYIKRTDTEDKEKVRNLRDAENRNAVIRAGNTISAGQKTTPQDDARIKNMSKREIEAIAKMTTAGPQALLKIASVFTSEQKDKSIKGNDNFNEDFQEKFEEKWNSRNAKNGLEEQLATITTREAQLKQRTTEMAQRALERSKYRLPSGTPQIPQDIKDRWKQEGARWQEEDKQWADAKLKLSDRTAIEQALKTLPHGESTKGSPEAPINKADKLIEKLDELQTKLSLPLNKLPLEIKHGNKITAKAITDGLSKAQDNIREKELYLDQVKKTSPKDTAKILAARTDVDVAKEVNETLKKLQETVEKIPMHTSHFTGKQQKGETEVIKK